MPTPPSGDSMVLSIGFPSHKSEREVENRYFKAFDIRLVDDQTMDAPYDLVERICDLQSVM